MACEMKNQDMSFLTSTLRKGAKAHALRARHRSKFVGTSSNTLRDRQLYAQDTEQCGRQVDESDCSESTI